MEAKLFKASGAVAEFEIDLSDPVVNRDPFPHFERIRALGPAVWSPSSSAWLVTDFEVAKSIFSNFGDFAQDAEMFKEIHGSVTLPGLDNPYHNEVRAIITPYVSRTAAEAQADVAQAVVELHMAPAFERLRSGESVDVAGLYRTISTEFVVRQLGVPTSDCPQFVKWAEDMAAVFDLAFNPELGNAEALRAAASTATRELGEYCDSALAQRKRSGTRDDLLTALANTAVELTPEEKRAYVVMMIGGGQDTTTAWAKNTTLALAQHPEQRRKVAEDRSLLRQTLDEVVRWQAPVMAELRVVRNADVTIKDVAVSQADKVVLLLGAAHRDPSRYENPNAFDVFREAKGNLGFGFGVHNCAGVNLARRLVTSLTETLLDQAPNYELAIPASDLDYGRSYAIRGPAQLPLALPR